MCNAICHMKRRVLCGVSGEVVEVCPFPALWLAAWQPLAAHRPASQCRDFSAQQQEWSTLQAESLCVLLL